MTNRMINKRLVVVDDEDAEVLRSLPWTYGTSTGIVAKVDNKTVYLHRLIMQAPSDLVVDHINRDKLDNRRANLRLCTQSQNSKNQGIPKNNTSGYKGVQLDPREGLKKRWRADIKVNRKRVCLGRYATKEEAAEAYNEAAIKYFGEYAALNVMD